MRQSRQNVSPFSNEARNIYVVEHLTQAMLSELKEKNISDISISDLCNEAGVGRASFYRNFASKEDILKQYIRGKILSWNEQVRNRNDSSLSRLYGSFFQFLKDDSDFYLLLDRKDLLYLLLEVYLEFSGPKAEMDNMSAYTTAFVTYGTFGWIREWISRGMQESAEEMSALLSSYGMR